MKTAIAAIFLAIILSCTGSAVYAKTHNDVEKAPIEWAKEKIRSDEKYKDKRVAWTVTPIEDDTLKKDELLYMVVAITEEDELVMDYYGVYIHLKKDSEKLSYKDLSIDADLFKTEVFKK